MIKQQAMMPQNHVISINAALAAVFHDMADCYRYLGNEERFRAAAYENVAKLLHNMQEDITIYATDKKQLDTIGGIGESIAGKIMEYLHTGKIETFEKLKKRVPFELLKLMDITGFGPATLKILHDKLQVNNKDELVKAVETGKLKRLKGFGEKKIENIQRALKICKADKRMLLKDAERLGNEILGAIKKMPFVQKAQLAGSLRRKKETIGDIDIVILAEPKYRKRITGKIIALPQVQKVLAKGNTKVSVLLSFHNIQVDIRLVNKDEYGAAMLYFTGSREHNIKLRTIARDRGYKINEYGLFDSYTNKRLAGSTEEEIYHFLKLKFIPPEQRLNKGEIEKAILNQVH